MSGAPPLLGAHLPRGVCLAAGGFGVGGGGAPWPHTYASTDWLKAAKRASMHGGPDVGEVLRGDDVGDVLDVTREYGVLVCAREGAGICGFPQG